MALLSLMKGTFSLQISPVRYVRALKCPSNSSSLAAKPSYPKLPYALTLFLPIVLDFLAISRRRLDLMELFMTLNFIEREFIIIICFYLFMDICTCSKFQYS